MTKEQYLKTIETIINSPRNDTQKITMLKQGFKLYVEENMTTKENKNPALNVNAPKLPTKWGYSG
ncbi:MAG: hypothetical protein IKW51_08360 [Bacteroidales bacterium]|nr:hypothetical protein [Bacteroidales bacterium]